nr:FRG domain-containing protein [Acinetobacter pittii]
MKITVTQKNISSISDLIRHLKDDFGDANTNIWYRGQSDKSWDLMPGFYRGDKGISESTLLKRFKQSASMLLDKDPVNSFSWMFLMQHYGLPTRLLDWSESPLIALYFALEDYEKYPNTDAILWCLKPTELNNEANIKIADENNFIPSFDDDDIIGSYAIESVISSRVRMNPIATIATRNNPRIQAQQGVFTIHHQDKIAINNLPNKENFLKSYVICSNNRSGVLLELKTLGFSKFSLFPELSSISEHIKQGF